MTPADLRRCRSLLFLPASNPRAIAKARTLAADLIVLDLEDSVKPEDKAAGREGAVAALAEGFGGRPVAVRVNATGTQWFGEDVVAIRHSDAPMIVLPKVERVADVHDAAQLLSKPVLAMIETPRGVIEAPTIATQAIALLAGVNDLAASLAIPAGAGRSGLAYSLQAVVVAARAAGIAAFDGVCNDLEDGDVLAAECAEGRAFGFDGKSLIHPSQVDTTNRLFSPTDAEVAAAERLVAAASGGAERFEGRMIETLHVEDAKAVLAKARRG